MRRALETRLPGSGSAPGPVAGVGLDRLAVRSRAPLSLPSRHSSGVGDRKSLRIPHRAQCAPVSPHGANARAGHRAPGARPELRVREPEPSPAPERRAHSAAAAAPQIPPLSHPSSRPRSGAEGLTANPL